MNTAEEEKKLEEGRTLSVRQGAYYGIMEGFGIRYITPYALAVGASNRIIGLLATLPGLLATLSQLLTLPLMRHWSRKRITLVSVLLQAAFWPILLIAGYLYFVKGDTSKLPGKMVLVFYSMMLIAGSICGPAWISWSKDIMPKNIGSFVSRRSRMLGIVALVSMLLAGLILDWFKKENMLFIGFCLLFLASFVGRLFSANNIRQIYEPPYKFDDAAYFSFLQFLKKMAGNNFGRFAIYISLLSLTANIYAPFGSVYMLKNLHFSYTEFTAVILVNSVFAIFSMGFWGRISDRFGCMSIIKTTGWIVLFIPTLWLLAPLFNNISHNAVLVFLIIQQMFSGFMWAGFEFAAGSFIYHAVTPQRTAICASYLSILNCTGALIGGLIGGYISSLKFTFFGFPAILSLFVIGSVLRLIVYLVMGSSVKEVRSVECLTLEEAKSSFVDFLADFKPGFIGRPGPKN
ncbi:MAG: MFS transporter [Fibrobacteres bacterium]|nr:MFS transporter [Fibrobacterota bacterium]